MFDARSNTPMLGYVRPKKVSDICFTFSRSFFIISLASLFLFNALGGDILLGEVWAARLSSGPTSVSLDSTGSPSPLKSLSAATFTLPKDLGYIQESAEVPGSDKTVIHIQDAHCNYAAQKSIAEILNYLTTEYGIHAVNCEGATESYDLSPFTAIPEKDIREKTADFFVKEGVVSAAEYFAVNNPRKVNLWGVEDPDLYLKNLKIYRDSLSHKAEVDKYIKSMEYILDNLKRHIYSDELLELDKYYIGYKENKINFKEYIIYLISMAQKRMIDIKSFSNIYLLSQTLADEDKINFKRANNEKDEVVDKLKKSLSRSELEELVVMVGKLKTERISQADFYAYLVKKAKSVKLDISVYPELQKYIIYISLYGAIDRTKVTEEIDTLEYRIKASLYENDTQRELGVLSKNLAITKNIFNISLTRDDYIYYKEHKEIFTVANYVSFIEKKAPLYKISAVLDKSIGSLDGYRESMDQFYECSLERDKAFIKNIKFTDHDRPNSIIITGGFHTENLRELFKNEKVSYVSIMPKFKNEKGYESPYMKRLAGQRTALENVIDTAIPAVLNLAIVNILNNRLALKVEGPAKIEQFRLAVAIMAAIMGNKQFILRLNKGLIISGKKLEEEKFITFSWPEGADAPIGTELIAEKPSGPINAALIELGPNVFKFEMLPVEGQERAVSKEAVEPAKVPSTMKTISEEQPPIIIDEASDEAFTKGIGIIDNNVRQNMMNIFIMRTRDESQSPQAMIGREAAGKFEKKYGINTGVLYFKDTNEMERKLRQALEMAMAEENKDKYPKILVDCLDETELNTMKALILKMKSEFKGVDLENIIAIAKDFSEDVKLKGLAIPHEVKVMIVGLAIMNDRRLSKNFSMSAEELFKSRKETLEFLARNKVIDRQIAGKNIGDITVADSQLLETFIDELWKGMRTLQCTRIDWNKLDEYKDSQRQLLQSV